MVNTRSGLANPGTSAQGGLSNSMDVDNQATNGGDDNAADVQRALAELKIQNEQLQKVVDNQTSRVKELEAQIAADAIERVDPSAAAVQKLFGKPPNFLGLEKSQNVRKWLFSMKLLIEAAKFTDEQTKVAFCVSHLEGKARSHWLHSMYGSYDTTPDGRLVYQLPVAYTMESFEKVMLGGFGHLDPVQVAWTKLNSLTQGVNDPPEYTRQFQAVCAELGAQAPIEEALIQYFLRRLNFAKLRTKVELKLDGSCWRGNDLQALVRQCTAIWPQIMAGILASKSYSGGMTSASDKQANNINSTKGKGKRFHKANNGKSQGNGEPNPSGGAAPAAKRAKLILGPSGRKLTREQINKLKKEGKCFRCEKTGHMTRDCPEGNANGSEN
jgi:hypothetical protein